MNGHFDKFLRDVNNPNNNLKHLCKFEVDISINARVMAVQSLEDLYIFILRQPCWWAKECPPIDFPYNIIENKPTLLAHNSTFNAPNDFKFRTDISYDLTGHTKILGKLIIFPNHIFDDII